MFTPSRLTLARKRRGLSKKTLANAVGVTDRMISFYEDGAKAPSEETLASIARVLRFPVEFFQGEDLEEPTLESVSFRALSSMTSGERDSAHAAGALALHLSRWIEGRFILPTPDIPSLRGFGDPETAAQALRAEWRLGERPIKNLTHLLESHGVRIFSLPADSRRVDAFSAWQGQTPFVFVNTSKTAERTRFDLAHELGHLTLHQHGKPSGRAAEHEADRFGAAFLMSKASILAHGPRNPSPQVLVSHKRRWGVSAMALAHRLHEVGLASDWTYRGLCIELAKSGLEEEPDPMPKEGSQILSKVLGVLRTEGLSHAAVARDLHIAAEELSALMFGLAVVPLGGGNQKTVAPRQPAVLRLVE
jgi:Zn-dependent peptidase ImmA (M78 family)/DNA-binding XRE family transcriptional regulator